MCGKMVGQVGLCVCLVGQLHDGSFDTFPEGLRGRVPGQMFAQQRSERFFLWSGHFLRVYVGWCNKWIIVGFLLNELDASGEDGSRLVAGWLDWIFHDTSVVVPAHFRKSRPQIPVQTHAPVASGCLPVV